LKLFVELLERQKKKSAANLQQSPVDQGDVSEYRAYLSSSITQLCVQIGLHDALNVVYVCENKFVGRIFGFILPLTVFEFSAFYSFLRGNKVSLFCNAYICDFFMEIFSLIHDDK